MGPQIEQFLTVSSQFVHLTLHTLGSRTYAMLHACLPVGRRFAQDGTFALIGNGLLKKLKGDGS